MRPNNFRGTIKDGFRKYFETSGKPGTSDYAAVISRFRYKTENEPVITQFIRDTISLQ